MWRSGSVVARRRAIRASRSTENGLPQRPTAASTSRSGLTPSRRAAFRSASPIAQPQPLFPRLELEEEPEEAA